MNELDPKPNENTPAPAEQAAPEVGPFLLGSKYEDTVVGILVGLFIPPVLVIAGGLIHPFLGFGALGAALIAFVAWYFHNPRVAVFFKSCVLTWLIAFLAIPLVLLGTCMGLSR